MANQVIVGSKIPTFASDQTQKSLRGYGQNGYGGASSETPGTARLISKGLSDVSPPPVKLPANNQTRNVGPNKLKTTRGMKDPNKATDKVPGSVNRR